jgi:hypothetical protein
LDGHLSLKLSRNSQCILAHTDEFRAFWSKTGKVLSDFGMTPGNGVVRKPLTDALCGNVLTPLKLKVRAGITVPDVSSIQSTYDSVSYSLWLLL